MDRDHRNHFSSRQSVLKKRYSFDVTLLEPDNILLLAQDRHGITETSTSAPTFSLNYPFVNEVPAQSDLTTTLPSSAAPQYQQDRLPQNNNSGNESEEQLIAYQQSTAENFASHDDFVLFRHPHSPQTNSADHPSPSALRMSPSSSLILDHLFPDLSSLL